MKLGWGQRASDEAAEDAVTDAEPRPFELAAIDLLTLEGRYTGWIATDGERTSDWLNQNPEITVRGLSSVPVDGELAVADLPGPDAAPPQAIASESIVFAVPPPLPANRHLRLHRRRLRIHIQVGEYEVSGQIHVRPGAQAGDYLLRSARQLVPLTDVELVHTGEPGFRRMLSVVIVNARHVTRIISGEGSTAETDAGGPSATVVQAANPAPARHSPKQGIAALQVLLEMGVLNRAEYQAKRATLLDAPGPTGG